MKKSALASAITAAVISSGAQSFSIISSISDIQIFVNTDDLVVPCPSPLIPGMVIGGTASGSPINTSNVSMNGVVCVRDPLWPPFVTASLSFGLTAGTYTTNHNPGVTFTDGSIDIDIYTSTSGWFPYGTINASATNIACLSHQPGHLGLPNNMTYGLWLAPGIWPLPGRWDPVLNLSQPDDGINDAVCVIDILGWHTGLYLKGNITLF